MGQVTRVNIVPWLLLTFESFCEETVAALRTIELHSSVWETVKATWKEWNCPTGREARSQTTLPLSRTQPGSLWEGRYVRPKGTGSETKISIAVAGPKLLTVSW